MASCAGSGELRICVSAIEVARPKAACRGPRRVLRLDANIDEGNVARVDPNSDEAGIWIPICAEALYIVTSFRGSSS
jgi:hypothetical protein